MTQDFGEFRPSRLWRRMSSERRMSAAGLFWEDEESTDQQIEAIGAIAGHMKFRTKTVLALPSDKRAKYLATLPNISDSIAARVLITYHLEQQRPMMAAFLDMLGIAHEDGLISDENVTKPDPARLRSAATELAGKFPAEDVSLYLATLVSQDPDTWGELADAPETRPAAFSQH